MLRRLRIENLVLIREADLPSAPGLSAIPGGRGAGKTILARAIGLLLGSRGDSSLVGPDATEAYVEAELDPPPGFFDDESLAGLAELRPEDEEGLVLARRVFSDGRTRAYAWGRSAAREDLAAAAERLIAMSGQFEQRRLARPSYQLDLLDAFAGEEQSALRTELRLAWRELKEARRGHDELAQGAAAAEARVAELRALVEDTEGLEPWHEEQLRAERERLRHVTELAEGVAAAREALAPDDSERAAGPVVAAAEAKVAELTTGLSRGRERAAEPFATAVAQELRGIGLGDGEFRVERRESTPGPAGKDEIAFLIRPNSGLPFAPVAETASGGELSRIALAIAAVGGGETLLFDEIDAGIGGPTAHAVCETLRRLAGRAQIVTITHLPQIASLADRHFRVEKVPGDPTHTRIDPLDDGQRKDEIRRMLGGEAFISAVQEGP